MKKVFVCSGAKKSLKSELINSEAELLGEILGQNGVKYLQGGSCEGLMGLTLKGFLKYSKNVEFILPKNWADNDLPKLKAYAGEDINIKIVDEETERLKIIKQSDVIVILPGGLGTVEELIYTNETIRSGEHKSEFYIINIDGYFDNLIKQIERNIEEGFTKPSNVYFKVLSSVNDLKI